MHALLLATANTEVHVAAPPDAGEILVSALQGELQKVAKWLRKGGPVNALSSTTTSRGQTSTFGLLHASAINGQLEVARELLKRGASVDLQNSQGYTSLMVAAQNGHLSVVLLLLQHSANPGLQDTDGTTALMGAAGKGYEACVQALLRAKANTELLDTVPTTALQRAEGMGQTAIAELLRQHTAASQTAAPPDAGEPAVSAPASVPGEILVSAGQGELQKVVKWLRKGGPVDALSSSQTVDGYATAQPSACCTPPLLTASWRW